MPKTDQQQPPPPLDSAKVELIVKSFVQSLQKPARIDVVCNAWLLNFQRPSVCLDAVVAGFITEILTTAVRFRVDNEALVLFASDGLGLYYKRLDRDELRLFHFMIRHWPLFFARISPGDHDEARPIYSECLWDAVVEKELDRELVCLRFIATTLKSQLLSAERPAQCVGSRYFTTWTIIHNKITDMMFDQRFAAFCRRALDLLYHHQEDLLTWDERIKILPRPV